MPLKSILHKISITALLILATECYVHAQEAKKMVPSAVNAWPIVKTEDLYNQIQFLTDTTFRGRATGTRGNAEAGFWIARHFRDAGLLPINGSFDQTFPLKKKIEVGSKASAAKKDTTASDYMAGHNIVGFLPGKRSSQNQTYVLICANYDSFGIIDGNFYPGADSNASGVVAMLKILDMLKYMQSLGRYYNTNVIFVAFDAKECNSAGSEEFAKRLKNGFIKDPVSNATIQAKQIKEAVVLDILGSTTSPLHPRVKDYLIMLSGPGERYNLLTANQARGLYLDLAYNYYGSDGFTDMFFKKIGDQKVLGKAGLPVAVFTSGITMKTNKVNDDAESLDYEIFRKRIILIFQWLTKTI